MPDKKDLQRILDECNERLRAGSQARGSLPPVGRILERINNPYQNSPSNASQTRHTQSHYTPLDGDLKSIVLPLSESESIVYLDNLLEKVVAEQRNSITSLQIYTYQETDDTVQLCSDISQAILQYRDQFPENYDTGLSKKEKSVVTHLISFPLIPSTILDVWSKESISQSGERQVDKFRIFPGLGKIVDATQAGLAITGGAVGAALGSLMGPAGFIVCGVSGAVLGYMSPAIAGACYWMKLKSDKTSRKGEYARIRNAIDNIATQVRLQETPLIIGALPDFRDDDIGPYLSAEIAPFRQPERVIREAWVYRGFKSVVDDRETLERTAYNMQRYYRAKIMQYEASRGL